MCAFETWEISEHSALTMTFVVVGERTALFNALHAFLINCTISIIKKARRAKKEVGKRSKSKEPDKIETENEKPGTRSLNKWPLRVLIGKINHFCQSIIPSNTNSGFSPWNYFARVSAEVRQSEDSMPKKLTYKFPVVLKTVLFIIFWLTPWLLATGFSQIPHGDFIVI